MSFYTGVFIKEIKNRPCIWDSNHEDYSNRERRHCAWVEIAEILYDDWSTSDEKHQAKKVQDLQKKWKGLRDYYNREKNKHPPINKTSMGRKKRRTPFLDMLQFLKETKHNNQDTDIPKKITKIIHQEALPSTSTGKQRENDPDLNFLLNILPEMKTMNPSENFEFRFEVMKLIKRMKYDKNNESQPQPPIEQVEWAYEAEPVIKRRKSSSSS